MSDKFYNNVMVDLSEHRGKPDPEKVRAREEAHKRGILRHKNALEREKELEAARKERAKNRKEREKEEKNKRVQNKEKRRQEKKQYWRNQLSKEDIDKLDNKRQELDDYVDAFESDIKTRNASEKKVKKHLQDAVSDLQDKIEESINNGEEIDIDSLLDDTQESYCNKLEKEDLDDDDFEEDLDDEMNDDDLEDYDDAFSDLQDEESSSIKDRRLKIEKEIKELKSKHEKELKDAKTAKDKKKVYDKNKKKLEKLKDSLEKLNIKNREDYQEYRKEKRAKKIEAFKNKRAVKFFQLNWYKITGPFVSLARLWNKMYEYNTDNIAK